MVILFSQTLQKRNENEHTEEGFFRRRHCRRHRYHSFRQGTVAPDVPRLLRRKENVPMKKKTIFAGLGALLCGLIAVFAIGRKDRRVDIGTPFNNKRQGLPMRKK
ncbi:MAG: hypothetical protein HGA67_03145 [Candidatus Yonathbacteria bacterium]|nr:hypothetical protein [Candidatus Yonathbacteria bacterium]